MDERLFHWIETDWYLGKGSRNSPEDEDAPSREVVVRGYRPTEVSFEDEKSLEPMDFARFGGNLLIFESFVI